MLLTYATILIIMSLGIALTRLKVFSFNKALISSIAKVFLGPLVGILIIYTFNLRVALDLLYNVPCLV